jgi:alpha-glucosidase
MEAEIRPGWWQAGVFYHIYPRSFADSDGDGVGDLRGITAHLDHLNDGTPASLGVAAIWLSPFYPSPMADFGYDVSDYCGVDPLFGTLADFDELVAEAHARGIRVLVDLVPNHTSDRHPWFADARASRGHPKRDWYVWADGRPDGGVPNNWLSSFESVGPAWTIDPPTGQYYLHSFTPSQPDLNWWNSEVREAMAEVLRFWLGRGVDGFRIDVAHRLAKDPELEDNPPEVAPLRRDLTIHAAPMHNIDWPETHAVLRRFRQTLDEYGAVAVGEVGILDLHRFVRYYGLGDELHMAFNFKFWQQPWSASAFRKVVGEVEALLPDTGWPVYTLSNHDIPRAISRYGTGGRHEARAHLAATMLLTLRGTPFVYYGEEIGMTDVTGAFAGDPNGRDPCRTPMQWDGSPGAGFTAGRPWLTIPGSARRVNVAAQGGDPGSLLNLYRRLIWLRRGSAALQAGTYRRLPAADECVFAYQRRSRDEDLVVALNFGDDRARLHGPQAGLPAAGERLLSTDADLARQRVSLDPYHLQPLEGVVIRLPQTA